MLHYQNPKRRKVIPDIGDDLIAYLEEHFPNALPTMDKATPQEMWRRIGTRDVVDHLKSQKKKQEKRNVSTESQSTKS